MPNLFKVIAQDEVLVHTSKQNKLIKHRLMLGEFATAVYVFTFISVFVLMSIYTVIEEVAIVHNSPPETADGGEDKTLTAPTYDVFKAVSAELGSPPICPCKATNPPLLGVDAQGKSTFVTPVVEVNALCTAANIDTRVSACADTTKAESKSAADAACVILKPIFAAVKSLCSTATSNSNAAKARAMKSRVASPLALSARELQVRVKEIFDNIREAEVTAFTTPWQTITAYARLERPITSVTTGYEAYSPWDYEQSPLPEAGKHYVPSNNQDLGEIQFKVRTDGVAAHLNTATCNCFSDFKCKKTEEILPASLNNGKPLTVDVHCSSTETMFNVPIELFTDKSVASKVLGFAESHFTATTRRRLQSDDLVGSSSQQGASSSGGQQFDDAGAGSQQGASSSGGQQFDDGGAGSQQGASSSGGQQFDDAGAGSQQGASSSGGQQFDDGSTGVYPSSQAGDSYGGSSSYYKNPYADDFKVASYTYQPPEGYTAGSQCNSGCPSAWIGDGICDNACNVPQCGYDTDPSTGASDCGGATNFESYGETLPPCYPFCNYAAYGGLETYEFSEGGDIYAEAALTASSFEDKGATKGPLQTAVNQGMLSKFGSIVDHKIYFEQVCQPKTCTWVTLGRRSPMSVATRIFGLLGGVAVVVKTFATATATVYDMQMKKRGIMYSGDGFRTTKRVDESGMESMAAHTASAVVGQ